MRLAQRDGAAAFTAALEAGAPFEAGNLTGNPCQPGPHYTGRLPEDYRQMLATADYVIRSYVTPIAWRTASDGLWFVPQQHYSMSTTRHQNLIRAAVKPLNDRTVRHG